MRRSRFLIGLAVVAVPAAAILLFSRAGFSQASADDPPGLGEVNPRPKTVPQRQWEYKQTVPCAFARGRGPTFEEELNDHGKKGWELVSLMPAGAGQASRDCFLATFKRETLH